MADVARTRAYYTRMPPGSNAVAERSRARRRRRLKMRRISAADRSAPPEGVAVTVVAPSSPSHGGPERVPAVVERNVVPVAGAVALAGRQRQMEDAVTIWTGLCSPAVNRRRPLHFFSVFDGHGGSHFSIMCKKKMHDILKEELMGVEAGPGQIGASGGPPPPPEHTTDETELQETWRLLMNRVFARTEMVALQTCDCGSEEFHCTCEPDAVSYSGTTAVAVVLTATHFVVGNCGDSRAVLYRGGRIIPLSFDHKPGRGDEKARIEASGGRVVDIDTPRVQGVLAMSRAIGDVFLKPYVISEPEVTFTRRDEEDEFVIIASDGMWDVISNAMAGRVAHQCLREVSDDSTNWSSSAASLLTRLALARGSVDNISVVVINLNSDASGV